MLLSLCSIFIFTQATPISKSFIAVRQLTNTQTDTHTRILSGLGGVDKKLMRGYWASSSIERKCPCMKKLKGEGNLPSYFYNDDVILHIIAKFRI